MSSNIDESQQAQLDQAPQQDDKNGEQSAIPDSNAAHDTPDALFDAPSSTSSALAQESALAATTGFVEAQKESTVSVLVSSTLQEADEKEMEAETKTNNQLKQVEDCSKSDTIQQKKGDGVNVVVTDRKTTVPRNIQLTFEEILYRAFDADLEDDRLNDEVLSSLRWKRDHVYQYRVKKILDEVERRDRGGILSYLQKPVSVKFFLQIIDLEHSRGNSWSNISHSSHYSSTRSRHVKQKSTAFFDRLVVVAVGCIDEFGVAPDFAANICSRNWERLAEVLELRSKLEHFVTGATNVMEEDLWKCVNFVFSFDEYKMSHSVAHGVFCSPLCRLTCAQAAGVLSSARGSKLVAEVVELFIGLSNMLVDYADCVDHKRFWGTFCDSEFVKCLLENDVEDSGAREQALLTLVRYAPLRFQRQLLHNLSHDYHQLFPSLAARKQFESYELAWRRSEYNFVDGGDEKMQESLVDSKPTTEWNVDDLIAWLSNTDWGSLTQKVVLRILEHLEQASESVDVSSFLAVETGKTHELHDYFLSNLQWRKFVSRVKQIKQKDVEILALRQFGVPVKSIDLPSRHQNVWTSEGNEHELGHVERSGAGDYQELELLPAAGELAAAFVKTVWRGVQSSASVVYQGLFAPWIEIIVARWLQSATQPNNSDATPLTFESVSIFRKYPRGLPNLGNTCFMNSGLQCISQTPIFVDMILGLDIERLEEAKRHNHKAWRLLQRYRELLFAMNCKTREQVEEVHARRQTHVDRRIVQRYHDALADFCSLYQEYRQLDAFESVSVLLDAIHDATKQQGVIGHSVMEYDRYSVDFDLARGALRSSLLQISFRELSKKFDQEYSIIDKLFYGYYGVFEQCLACDAAFFQLEPWKCVDICLDPLLHDFQLAFDAVEAVQTQSLQDYDWQCPTCRSKSGVVMWKKFLSVPAVLLIHVSRCHHAIPYSKLTEALNYPQTFEVTTLSGNTVAYENYGVCLHGGSTIRGGHYTAAVKTLHGNHESTWFNANDSSVTRRGKTAPRPDGREIALFYVAK